MFPLDTLFIDLGSGASQHFSGAGKGLKLDLQGDVIRAIRSRVHLCTTAFWI